MLNADGKDFNLQQSQDLIFKGDDWCVHAKELCRRSSPRSWQDAFTNENRTGLARIVGQL